VLLAAHAGITFRWHGFFGAHLATFLVFSAGLIAINRAYGGYPWSVWVVASLAVLVLTHGLVSFRVTSLFGAHVIATILVAAELLVVAATTDETVPGLMWPMLALGALLAGHAVLRTRRATLYQVHVATFVAVNLLLFLENITTGDGELWFQYPLIAWSVLLAIHTLVHFRFLGFPDESWERSRLARLGAEAGTDDPASPELTALQERVRLQRGLLTHLFFFGVAAVDLTVLNILSTPDRLWLIWPLGVWSVILAAHVGYVLVPARLFGAHLFGAIALSLGLIAIDAWTGGGAWAYWPILGLALTVVIHAAFVFNVRNQIDHWEERRVASMLE
jgi:hypothetical protein